MDSVKVIEMYPFGGAGEPMVMVCLTYMSREYLVSFGLTSRGRVKIVPPTFEVLNRNEHQRIDADQLPKPIWDWVKEMKPSLLIALTG